MTHPPIGCRLAIGNRFGSWPWAWLHTGWLFGTPTQILDAMRCVFPSPLIDAVALEKLLAQAVATDKSSGEVGRSSWPERAWRIVAHCREALVPDATYMTHRARIAPGGEVAVEIHSRQHSHWCVEELDETHRFAGHWDQHDCTYECYGAEVHARTAPAPAWLLLGLFTNLGLSDEDFDEAARGSGDHRVIRAFLSGRTCSFDISSSRRPATAR